jgi:hypothetical protein
VVPSYVEIHLHWRIAEEQPLNSPVFTLLIVGFMRPLDFAPVKMLAVIPAAQE